MDHIFLYWFIERQGDGYWDGVSDSFAHSLRNAVIFTKREKAEYVANLFTKRFGKLVVTRRVPHWSFFTRNAGYFWRYFLASPAERRERFG